MSGVEPLSRLAPIEPSCVLVERGVLMAKLAEKGFEPLIDAKEASVITGLHYSATRGDGRTHRPKEGKEMQKLNFTL